MTKLVANLYYFPPVAYCAYWAQHSNLTIEGTENYQKRSFRNKCDILTHQGKRRLSVPLKRGKHQSKPYRDVQISYDDAWVRHHLLSIRNAYNQAPYFEHYFDKIEPILKNRYKFLFDLNLAILAFLAYSLDTEWELNFTDTFQQQYDLRTIDIRDNFDDRLKRTRLAPYQQIFSHLFDFQTDLSILDLLFCKGPEATIYLGDQCLTKTSVPKI